MLAFNAHATGTISCLICYRYVFVEEGKIVTLVYELRSGSADGELLERMNYNWPLIFYFGSGTMLKAFEAKLNGLKEESTFEFVLKAEEAYGFKDPSLLIKIPKEKFLDPDTQQPLAMPGEYVNLNEDHDQLIAGKVVEVNQNTVIIDCNHEMAGKDLHFKGMIADVREATVEEHIQKRYIESDGVRF